MNIDVEELVEIVPEVWFPVFGTSLEPVVCASAEHHGLAGGAMGSEISISGAWNGTVVVESTDKLLRDSASVMFAAEVDDVSADDAVDTLCEVTNMIGGTLKSILPEPCELSIPSMFDDAVPVRSADDGQSVAVEFLCGGEPLRVTVRPA